MTSQSFSYSYIAYLISNFGTEDQKKRYAECDNSVKALKFLQDEFGFKLNDPQKICMEVRNKLLNE